MLHRLSESWIGLMFRGCKQSSADCHNYSPLVIVGDSFTSGWGGRLVLIEALLSRILLYSLRYLKVTR